MMAANAARPAVDGKRPFRRAWDEDGLPDLAAGFSLAIQGVLTLGEQRILRGLFGFAFVLGGRWLIGKAKSQISDRRTGYVRPRRLRGDDWVYGVAWAFAYLSFLIFAAARGWPFESILLAVVATLPLLVWFLTFSRRYLGLTLVSLAAAGIA